LDRPPLQPAPVEPFNPSPEIGEAIDRFARRLDAGDPFFAVVAHSITPMVVSDPTLADNPLVYVNQAFEALTGFNATEVLGRNCRFMQGPLTEQADIERLRDAIRNHKQINIDLLNHRRDGTPFWNRLMVAPVFSAEGELRYFVASQLDVTLERHRLRQLQDDRDLLTAEVAQRELDLAEREARLALALKAGGLGTWTIDLPDMKLAVSTSCLANFGRPTDEDFTFEKLGQCLHPEDAPRVLAAMQDTIDNGAPYDLEYRILTPSGEQRWVHIQGSLQRRADGTPLALSGFSANISVRKFAEEHRAVLAHELTHRVKNTLATVGAVVRQTLRDAASLDEASHAISGRIASLAAAHEVLVKDEAESASLGDIVRRVLAPFADKGERRFIISGPAIRLTPAPTLALSMALHELATNAIKYGALSVPEGKVSIQWELHTSDNDRYFSFTWLERGGPKVEPPSRSGFGTRMIERVLSRHVRGVPAVEYQPDGLRFAIEVPV
jgi:PAS domain S-box-containing protein